MPNDRRGHGPHLKAVCDPSLAEFAIFMGVLEPFIEAADLEEADARRHQIVGREVRRAQIRTPADRKHA